MKTRQWASQVKWIKKILTCTFGLNLTILPLNSRSGSGLVFIWASELYLSKKECVLEVLGHALERPIIKSGPPLEGNAILTFLFSPFYCSSLQLSLFVDSLSNPTFYNLHTYLTWSCSSPPFLPLFSSPQRPLQHLLTVHRNSSSSALVSSPHKQPWHGLWVPNKLWNGVSTETLLSKLLLCIDFVLQTKRNGGYPRRDDERYWYHPSRAYGERERELRHRYEQSPFF